MFKVIISLDYEIHGNGEGSPLQLMVKSTEKLINIFDQYGAKLSIMADVAEIMQFKNFYETHGVDYFNYQAIEWQLKQAIQARHDVQLHLHPSYYNAKYVDGYWHQDYSEYNLAYLSYERMFTLIKEGKEYLENILITIDPDYRCIAFRAANWSMQPSLNIINALINNGFRIDSSVFKYGTRDGLVNFDYSNALSNLIPWRVDKKEICAQDKDGLLIEIPIYCELRWIFAFVTLNRIIRIWQSHRHKLGKGLQHSNSIDRVSVKNKIIRLYQYLTTKHAWKADINQCSGKQLIKALNRIENKYDSNLGLPIVFIGHSKIFNRNIENNLKHLFTYIHKNKTKYDFATYRDFIINDVISRV